MAVRLGSVSVLTASVADAKLRRSLKLTTGAQIGPYTILGPLGSGGMGEVYRALDTRLGREVALKILTDGLVGRRDALERFERQATDLRPGVRRRG